MSVQSQRSRLTVRRPRIRDVVSTIPLLLIGLKLGGVIPLSWWWVLAPIWIPLIPGILIGVGLLLVVGGVVTMNVVGRWFSRWYLARLRRRNPDWPRVPAP